MRNGPRRLGEGLMWEEENSACGTPKAREGDNLEGMKGQ